MRNKLILLWMFVFSAVPAWAQLSVRIGLPGIDIGINLPLYPELMPVPGYPVYYAPQLNSNYFFYDGMYWVFQDDNWYASSWYNGPWNLVDQEVVPVFVLRIPVRYYRQSPHYFRGWRPDAPPRWGERWGDDWQQRHHGWDKWNRSTPAVRPPLPVYQRNYTGERYPQLKEQQTLQNKNYHYQPHDPLVRQQVQDVRRHVTSIPTRNAPVEAQPRPQLKPAERTVGGADIRDNPPNNVRDHQRDKARTARDENTRSNAPQPTERQQPPRAQLPDNPHTRQAAQQTDQLEAHRPQKAEPQQERERPREPTNERTKEHGNERGNDKDEERGADRRNRIN